MIHAAIPQCIALLSVGAASVGHGGPVVPPREQPYLGLDTDGQVGPGPVLRCRTCSCVSRRDPKLVITLIPFIRDIN